MSPPLYVPYSRVVCDGNELKYVQEVLESGWLTTAGMARLFEERFAAAVSGRFACAVNSCTAALHLALEALGVGPGDRVLVPTMTFTSTAEVVRYLGADPVFLDVEYGTSLVTPEIVDAAARKSPGCKALMIVHFGGQAAEMFPAGGRKGILDVCAAHGIKVVSDAAHAFPARAAGRPVGSFGDATCFSLYANKTITTGEGGLLVTGDERLAARARVMRLHGIDRDAWDRHTSGQNAWEYDVVAPGFKYNLSDVAAAIGLAQLERCDAMRAGRERCARHYFRRLEGLKCLDLPVLKVAHGDHAWHLFAMVLKPDAPMSRDRLVAALAERGVGTAVHYKPLHRMSYYRDRYSLKAEDFPEAERIWKGCLSLPIYHSLTEEQLDRVCDSLVSLLG